METRIIEELRLNLHLAEGYAQQNHEIYDKAGSYAAFCGCEGELHEAASLALKLGLSNPQVEPLLRLCRHCSSLPNTLSEAVVALDLLLANINAMPGESPADQFDRRFTDQEAQNGTKQQETPTEPQEPDGPCGFNRWRFNGATLPGEMTNKPYRLAKHLHERIGRKVSIGDLNGDGKLFNHVQDATVQYYGTTVSTWFSERDVPLVVESGGGIIWMQRVDGKTTEE